MISSMLICLLAASTAFAFPADSSSGGCPGGYADGAEIERGRLIFVCKGGQVVPKGCIAEDLTRLSIGGNYDTKQYRMKCQTGSDGQLSYGPSGCLVGGNEHKVDETFDEGANFYKCTKDGDVLKVTVLGCVDGGKRVNLKDSITKDNAMLSCEETVNNGAKLLPAGCVKEGKQYKAGETFEDGKFWFNCTRTGREKVVAKPAGCVFDGKRLNDGDRYTDSGIFYECMADQMTTRATGCAQTDGGNVVERRLGCTWVEGTAPFQYEWQCKNSADGKSAVKEQVRCNYNVGGGVYNVDPGCFRAVDKGVVGCSKEGTTLKLQAFEGENAEKSATGAGLKSC
jgi:hypothetical protein